MMDKEGSEGQKEIATKGGEASMMAVLGQAEGLFVASLTAPLCWVVREPDGSFRARNGSAFFLDAGEGPFCVTACHVIEGLRQACASENVVAFQLGNLPIDFKGRHSIIAEHKGLDIATFRVSTDEIASIGKTVLTGYQEAWPPRPPDQNRGIYYAGFPGVERRLSLPSEISFGVAAGGGVANSVSETDISSLIERENLIPVLGRGLPPENYDFGGMSGGPMLSVIETRGLRSWALAGVIYQGPNTSSNPDEAIAGLEIIKARRAYFIQPDGRLDIQRWDSR